MLKPPKAAPIEPYKPEHINAFIKVLDYDWQVATTTRQKMLAARDRSVLLSLRRDATCRISVRAPLTRGEGGKLSY